MTANYSPNRKQGNNVTLAKKNAIQLIVLISSFFVLLIKIITGILWVFKFILSYIAKFGIRYFLLPIYKRLKTIKLKIQIYYKYWQNQFGENFSRNMIIYGGLVLLSLFATAGNLKAREIRPEEVGKNSSLYTLLAYQGDFDLLIEESLIIDEETGNYQKPETSNTALSEVGVLSNVEPTGTPINNIESGFFAQEGDSLIRPDLTATDITPQLRDKIITYVVQQQDTISEIAELFDLSTNTILWENKIGPRDFIKPGQELVILPVTGVTHTIKKGDTLNAVASKYKSKSDDILEVNKLADASELRIGAKIVIPDGIPPPAPRTYSSYSSGLADIRDIFKPAKAIAGKLNWPTTKKRITQYFRGWRHTGLDIGVPTGQPIYASESGIVTTSGWNARGYGYYIIVDHGGGINTLYAHNSKNYVKKGERVKKGDIIGAIGSTGRSTGPHVHFEVRVNGNRVNPLDYL
jgi:LysM repeat protein